MPSSRFQFIKPNTSNFASETAGNQRLVEVEKKFRWVGDNKCVIGDCESLGTKIFTDIYFDTPNYALTTRDIWLRQREKTFECKIPVPVAHGATSAVDRYDELTAEEEILHFLESMKQMGSLVRPKPAFESLPTLLARGKKPDVGIARDWSLESWLEQNMIRGFTAITTTRRKYRKGKFLIDLDEVDFGYSIGEVEMLVEEIQVESAVQEVEAFCRENSFDVRPPIRGKVLEWLARYSPKHYNALQASGLLAAKQAV